MRRKRMRKFHKVKRIAENIELPKRSTKNSAGYDFVAIEDVTIEPSITQLEKIEGTYETDFGDQPIIKYLNCLNKPTMVKTGIKVEMESDEVLLLFNRSSNPKKGLLLANGVGVIDADYFENEDNDGEMAFPFYNVSCEPITIHKGDKLGQGVFVKYLTTVDDNADGIRTGGFGSTGK